VHTSASEMRIQGEFSFESNVWWLRWVKVDLARLPGRLSLIFDRVPALGMGSEADDLLWMLAVATRASVGFVDGVESGHVVEDIEKIVSAQQMFAEERWSVRCSDIVITIGRLEMIEETDARGVKTNVQDIAGLERIREAAAAAGFPLVIRDV
jgi:hypothetical protein